MRSIAIRLGGVLILAQSLGAQPSPRARIIGRTHARGDSTRAVPDAEVALFPGARTTRSDSIGAFAFAAVADGEYRLRVRRLGFEASELIVEVSGQHDRTIQVPLLFAPQSLAEVRISGRRVIVPARYAEAYGRVARANGDFFTRERMDSMQALDMGSLLRTIPGVYVNERGITFRRCEANLSSQGIPSSISPRPQGDSSTVPRAHVQVYVDGVRVTGYSARGGDDAAAALRDIRPSQLELVEVYRGVARIPGEYLDDACAVILIWTK